MTAREVVSSMIHRVAHDTSRLVLYVEFQSGHYKYEDVSPKLAGELVAAESVGKYFIANIRDAHICTKIAREEFERAFTRLGVKFEINWDRVVPLIEFS